MRFATAISALLLTACPNAEAPPTTDVRLCDGSDTLRMYARITGDGSGVLGEQIYVENGASILLVDGHCNYWVTDPKEVAAEVRRGSLSEEQAADLSGDLAFSQWPTWTGEWPSPGGFHIGPLVLQSRDATVVVHGPAEDSGGPEGLRDVRSRYESVVRDLWLQGTPAEGAVRYVVVDLEPQPNDPGIHIVDWPLETPISEVAITQEDAYANGYGRGLLVTDPVSAALLRDLKQMFLDGVYPWSAYRYIPVMEQSSGRVNALFVRDVLPAENDIGFVEFGGMP